MKEDGRGIEEGWKMFRSQLKVDSGAADRR